MLRNIAKTALAAAAVAGACLSVNAQQTASVSISVKNHQFEPREIHAPAMSASICEVADADSSFMSGLDGVGCGCIADSRGRVAAVIFCRTFGAKLGSISATPAITASFTGG